MRGYLSGQISGLSQEDFVANFARAEELARREGIDPVNPLDVKPCDESGCGAGEKLPDGTQKHFYTCYMKHDIIAELGCDMIIMLPNWHNSEGAKFELKVAKFCGMKVHYISGNYDRILNV